MKPRAQTVARGTSIMESELNGLQTLLGIANLFDRVSNVVFFAKDLDGRYIVVSQSLIERSGYRDASDMIGKHVRELYPTELACRYAAQDETVLRTGTPMAARLELGWYPKRRAGWCLTSKEPLRDVDGQIVGLVGLSRDLHAPVDRGIIPNGLADALEYLEQHYADAITPATLAARAGLTPARLAQLVKRIHGQTPRQLILQARLAAASRLLLETSLSVAAIALDCGFYDHSALATAFRQTTGQTPSEYRQRR